MRPRWTTFSATTSRTASTSTRATPWDTLRCTTPAAAGAPRCGREGRASERTREKEEEEERRGRREKGRERERKMKTTRREKTDGAFSSFRTSKERARTRRGNDTAALRLGHQLQRKREKGRRAPELVDTCKTRVLSPSSGQPSGCSLPLPHSRALRLRLRLRSFCFCSCSLGPPVGAGSKTQESEGGVKGHWNAAVLLTSLAPLPALVFRPRPSRCFWTMAGTLTRATLERDRRRCTAPATPATSTSCASCSAAPRSVARRCPPLVP